MAKQHTPRERVAAPGAGGRGRPGGLRRAVAVRPYPAGPRAVVRHSVPQ
ncbi:hypothetical protein [Streptomyces yaizuensis]|uniref:Uncharacterized protein n=1 Tax=Streptomyces yaizuensis TaxID=2989713 RepID=A0ABQ5NT70_9ACTN|nr:hypothetical protein [Streptomyces sp. YSPA8]GLF93567.1 hypothetical protein SYYSPA8_04740 [Streptomyces sp. YSPA8]